MFETLESYISQAVERYEVMRGKSCFDGVVEAMPAYLEEVTKKFITTNTYTPCPFTTSKLHHLSHYLATLNPSHTAPLLTPITRWPLIFQSLAAICQMTASAYFHVQCCD
jgi:hypothetical protein